MKLYPAIDLLDGRVVRLMQGEFDAVTDYGGDPVGVAERYREQGADWIHVVDLSGARDGMQGQTEAIASICATGLKVQSGGGVRSRGDVARLLNSGVSRVIIGSLAVGDPKTVCRWIDEFGPDAIVAAFDVNLIKGVPYPTLHGWVETAKRSLDELLNDYAGSGLRHALATDIGRDGALSGPSTDLYLKLVEDWPDINWQASGGVAQLSDLSSLKQSGVDGAIIGKALFEKRFTLAEAFQCLRAV